MKTKTKGIPGPKNYFTGGALLGLAGNAAQQLLSIGNYQANPNDDPYKVDWGNVLSSGGVGIVSELIKKHRDEQQRRKMVMSATPGAYNNGGPIYMPTITNPKVSNTTQPVIQPSMVINGLLGNMTVALPKQREAASHSKSRERFRERAMGGDIALSDSAVQIQGSPNQVDGNYYPTKNVRLDHNEVVKDNFVYSNRLADEKTGQSYARLAQRIEAASGKAQLRLKHSPYDPISQNTIAINQRAMASLAGAQENQASAAGLRGGGNGFAAGGQMGDPVYMLVEGKNSQMGINRGIYYDPSTDKFLGRDAFGAYYPVDYQRGAAWKQTNENNIAAHKQQYFPEQANNAPYNTLDDMLTGMDLAMKPRATAPAPQTTIQPRLRGPQGKPNPAAPTAAQPNGTYPGPYSGKDAYLDLLVNQNTDKYTMSPVEPLNMLQRQVSTSVGVGQVTPQIKRTTATTPTIPGVANTANPNAQDRQNKRGLIMGDVLQGVEVLSKFAQLSGGPEKEKPYYDETAITKNTYDPNQALYQNQRNYDGALSGLNSGSINSRRAYANSMLASKLNADNQTLSQYNQMNKAALTEYENRVASQRRYNVAQTVYTNDINAQNRAAYQQATDVAFNSLGNFGQALNQRKQTYAQLNIMKSLYPEVYQRIYAAANGNQ